MHKTADNKYKQGWKAILWTGVAALLVCFAMVLAPGSKASADYSNYYLRFEGNGDISGVVGEAIEPYYFTLHIVGGGFKTAFGAGGDATSFFQGKHEPYDPLNASYKGFFNGIPQGLTIKAVDAISVGDTEGRFVITGTPRTGSTQRLYPNWTVSQFFDPGAYSYERFLEIVEGV